MEMLFKHMEANNVAFIILNSSNRWLGIALVSINFYKFTLNVRDIVRDCVLYAMTTFSI